MTLAPLLQDPRHGRLHAVSLTADGRVLASVTAAAAPPAFPVRAFVFHPGFRVWAEVGDAVSPVARGSALYSTLAPASSPAPLAALQGTLADRAPAAAYARAAMLQTLPPAVQTRCTTSLLELQVAAAAAVGSAVEHERWLQLVFACGRGGGGQA